MVLFLTVEIAVDFGSSIRWESPTVLCL